MNAPMEAQMHESGGLGGAPIEQQNGNDNVRHPEHQERNVGQVNAKLPHNTSECECSRWADGSNI